jgi:hypothetical protein
MGNCKDCQYWDLDTYNWNTSWSICACVDDVRYSEKIDASSFAMYADAHDDSGLEYGLKTGPMFGCVKFKATAGG